MFGNERICIVAVGMSRYKNGACLSRRKRRLECKAPTKNSTRSTVQMLCKVRILADFREIYLHYDTIPTKPARPW